MATALGSSRETQAMGAVSSSRSGSGSFADSVKAAASDGIQTVHGFGIFIIELVVLDSIFASCAATGMYLSLRAR
ncbi:hypothetical protein PG984_015716 [Apiospora sp. TS-2023a]